MEKKRYAAQNRARNGSVEKTVCGGGDRLKAGAVGCEALFYEVSVWGYGDFA